MRPMEIDQAVSIRTALPEDCAAIAAIYQHAVLHGTATFELVAPDATEIGRRMADLLNGGFPWLIAEADGHVLGYAYAGPYRARPAYCWTVEDSVYVSPDHMGRGIGRALLQALIVEATRRGFRQMIAVISDDRSPASVELHRSAGFVHTGTLPSVGWKHGRWLATELMQRPLGSGDASAPDGEPPQT